VNEPGGAIMSVTDQFAQIDISRGLKNSTSKLELFPLKAPKADQLPSKYRKKFQDSLQRKRLDQSDNSQRNQKLENRAREEVSTDRNSVSANNELRDSSRSDVSVNRDNRSAKPVPVQNSREIKPENRPGENNSQNAVNGQAGDTNAVVSKEDVQLAEDSQISKEQDVSNSLNQALEDNEISEPPAGLKDILKIATEISGDANLNQPEAAFNEQEITPPVSLFKAIDTISGQDENVQSEVDSENLQVLDSQLLSLQNVLQTNSNEGNHAENSEEDDISDSQILLNSQQALPAASVDRSEEKTDESAHEVQAEEVIQGSLQVGIASDSNQKEQSAKSSEVVADTDDAETDQLQIRKDHKTEKTGLGAKIANQANLNEPLDKESSGNSEISAGTESKSDKTGLENALGAVASKIDVSSEKSGTGQNRAIDVITSVGENKASANRSATATKVSNGPKIESSEFLDRVSSAVQRAHTSGKQMKVRLNPPELGSLLVEVSTKDGVLTARMEVQTKGAQQAIMENLSQLKEAFVQSGNQIETIEVHVIETSTEENKQNQESDQQQDSRENLNENQDDQQNDDNSEAPPDDQSGQELQLDELDIQI
jgi:flagellar hook-length control protein FliK